MHFTRFVVAFMATLVVLFVLSGVQANSDLEKKKEKEAELLENSVVEHGVLEEDDTEPVCIPEKYLRLPPVFPNKCSNVRGKKHFVTLLFNVNEKGRPAHIEVIDQSHRCFVPSAKLAVRKWKYGCEYFGRENMETTITFNRM